MGDFRFLLWGSCRDGFPVILISGISKRFVISQVILAGSISQTFEGNFGNNDV
jgi:hypothetical protein